MNTLARFNIRTRTEISSGKRNHGTNLLLGAWNNLGPAIQATNAVMITSDAPSSDPQRFYRIQLP